MAWKRPSPALAERFMTALPKHPDAEPRKMFGYPACFVNGNFFVGVHEENIVVRLPGALREGFPELAEASRFDPRGTGKGMTNWWIVPAAIATDGERLATFLEATFAEVRKLPAKAARTRAPRGKSIVHQ